MQAVATPRLCGAAGKHSIISLHREKAHIIALNLHRLKVTGKTAFYLLKFFCRMYFFSV